MRFLFFFNKISFKYCPRAQDVKKLLAYIHKYVTYSLTDVVRIDEDDTIKNIQWFKIKESWRIRNISIYGNNCAKKYFCNRLI